MRWYNTLESNKLSPEHQMELREKTDKVISATKAGMNVLKMTKISKRFKRYESRSPVNATQSKMKHRKKNLKIQSVERERVRMDKKLLPAV